MQSLSQADFQTTTDTDPMLTFLPHHRATLAPQYYTDTYKPPTLHLNPYFYSSSEPQISNSLQMIWQHYTPTHHPRGSNTPTGSKRQEEGNAAMTHLGSWASWKSLKLLSLGEK